MKKKTLKSYSKSQKSHPKAKPCTSTHYCAGFSLFGTSTALEGKAKRSFTTENKTTKEYEPTNCTSKIATIDIQRNKNNITITIIQIYEPFITTYRNAITPSMQNINIDSRATINEPIIKQKKSNHIKKCK